MRLDASSGQNGLSWMGRLAYHQAGATGVALWRPIAP